MSDIKNILLVGVGGQGVLTASEILSEALLLSGYDVKKAEVHGMSQRGGSVNSHVRFGKKVYSPLIAEGEADMIFSFELLESMRNAHYLKKDGFIVASNEKIVPNSVYVGGPQYPENPELLLKNLFGNRFYCIDADTIAKEIGSFRYANVVLIGAVASLMKLSDDSMMEAIKSMVPPKSLDGNIAAYKKGKELVRA